MGWTNSKHSSIYNFLYFYNLLFFSHKWSNEISAYVNNTQKDLDKFKERNGPSNIYDDKQLKLLVNDENNVKMLHH